MPRVDPDPPSVSDAAAGAPEAPAEEAPELKPLHASPTAVRSEGDAAPALDAAAFLPVGAVELANTRWPFCTVTPAVAPFSRAANCWAAPADPDGLPEPTEPEPTRPLAGCVAPPPPPVDWGAAVRRPPLA